MTRQDRERFGAVVEALAANFRAELGDGTILLLWSALADKLSIGEFERAAARAVCELRFMPNAGELLELAGRKRGGPASKVRVIDGEAWTWLEGSGWGRYHGPVEEAARSVGMEPEAAREILGRMPHLLPPPANTTGGKR